MSLMEVNEVEYKGFFTVPFHAFNSTSFNVLNQNKSDALKYVVYPAEAPRIGMIFGIKDNKIYSPFSAPFGGPTYLSPAIKLQQIEEFFLQLEDYAKNSGLVSVNLTLPPLIYSPSFLSKLINVLFRLGYHQEAIDLNYSYNTSLFKDYTSNIWRNARKNLNVALNCDFEFQQLYGEAGIEKAYEIIRQNREQKGFPLRMSLRNLIDTSHIVPVESFLLLIDKIPVASAIIYIVSKNIVQIVYWGDVVGRSNNKPMNLLAFKVFEFYSQKGIEIVDIGPSTENSKPNFGLCEFKEGIGADISLKYSFSKKIN